MRGEKALGLGLIVPAVVVAFALPGAAAVADMRVSAGVSSQHVYVGDDVRLTLRIDDGPPDVQPELPAMDGFTVQALGGGSSMSSIRIINGQMTRESYVTFNYRLTPTRAGTLTIPPIRVTAGGKTCASQAITIEVIEPQEQDIVFLELSSERDEYWIDQPFRVVLRIGIRQATMDGRPVDVEPMFGQDPPALTIPWLTDLSGCEAEDLDEFARRYHASRTGLGFSINDLAMEGWFPTDRDLARFSFFHERKQRAGLDGEPKDYYVYTMSQKFRPTSSGTLQIAPVRFKGTIPLEVTGSLGRLRVSRQETIVVLSNALELVIKEPPLDGRPPSYTGAIGSLSMDVTAKPTEVAAGDPITLQIRIRGDARLENVGPPPLADNPALTAGFKVPEDPTAGVIDEQAKAKTFTQSIRPTSEDVTEIPPIELSYFDTDRGQYVTLASEPIPIVVHAGKQLPLDAVVADELPSGGRDLTESTKGILANYTDMDEVLVSQATTLGWEWYAPATVSPIVYIGLWLWQRRRLRLRGDVALARRVRAARDARRTLGAAAHHADAAEITRIVTAGLLNYLADRFNLPAGGLTKAEALARLAEQRVDGELRAELDDLLTRCEVAVFSGSGLQPDGLVDRARRCIDRLERLRLR